VFLSALMLFQCSRLCFCVPVGHYKWFLVQCNELSLSHGTYSLLFGQVLSSLLDPELTPSQFLVKLTLNKVSDLEGQVVSV
jgi:hypothetical protein